MTNLECILRLLKLRILYVKVAVAHGNNKNYYISGFSIFLVKILDTGKQVSSLLHPTCSKYMYWENVIRETFL